MLIRNRQKEYSNHHFKKSIFTLAGTTGQRVLNKSFCGSYFRMFWVLLPRIFRISLIICYWNQWLGSFISSKFNSNFLKMRWQNFVLSAIIATKQLLEFFWNSENMYPSSFYQSCCVSSFWFTLDDTNQGEIYIFGWRTFYWMVYRSTMFYCFFFRTYMAPYLRNSLSLLVKIYMTEYMACMPMTKKIIS